MEATELIKKVRKIELKMRGLTNQVLTGGYHSAFKGRGMTFNEVRAYQPGDDVRSIDWNVTARTGEPFIKKYEEERELSVLLLIDVSGSAFTGSRDATKLETITEIAALLALSAIRNHDKVGLLLFAEKPIFYLPPRTGTHHLLRIIREILQVEQKPRGTNIADALSYCFNLQKQRSICFVLSDFLDHGFEKSLRVLAGRHDVIGVHMSDPLEQKLPDIGVISVFDPETGKTQWLDTSQTDMRLQYQKAQNKQLDRVKNFFLKNKADYLEMQTDIPYFTTLLSFFQQHAKHK
jgi:uncharacterized protein (DUF58 family)